MRKIFLPLLLAAIFLVAGVLPAVSADTGQRILSPRFRTLKVMKEGDFMAPPVINPSEGERLIVSFDEIADDRSFLMARLVHCNADWQPSQLLDSEYADGFNEARIDDYAFSQNTFIHYVNYRVVVPSENLSPLKSGNYLLEIYPEDDPDEVLLQVRFAVSERRVAISGYADGRTDRGFNDSLQQLSMNVATGDYRIGDPFSELVIAVEQNGSPASAVQADHPLRISSEGLIYEHLPELIFKAGNEYRRFETVRADYPGMGVDSVRFENGIYHAYLAPGSKRVASNYEYDRTQHGRYLIREYNATDADVGADYVIVHFTLLADEFSGADVYVDGEFTSRTFSDANKMTFDPQLKAYTLAMPLKQGSYNYRFVALPKGVEDPRPDASPIEGDFHETRNEYNVKLFHRAPGSRADRLVGDAVIYSY